MNKIEQKLLKVGAYFLMFIKLVIRQSNIAYINFFKVQKLIHSIIQNGGHSHACSVA